jgi:DNA-binding transcriptional LysR family regulator
MALSSQILRRLKLRELRIFAATAAAGSMARAAKALSMSQPAVSSAVAELEQIVGAKLFDRTPRGIEPTVFGRAMLKRTNTILDEIVLGAEEIRFLGNPTSGELKLCCSEGMACGFLPLVLHRVLKKHPGFTFLVVSAETPNRTYGQLVAERFVELALSRYPRPFLERDLEAEHLFDDPLVVVVGSGHALARKRRPTLSDLRYEKWILLPTDAAIAGVMHDVFAAAKVPLPKAVVYTMSIHVRLNLLATNEYVTMMPDSSLRASPLPRSLIALPVDLPGSPGPVGIVHRKGHSLSPVAEIFAIEARAAARTLRQRA